MIYQINNLTFSYNKDIKVLENVSLDINEGELITFLGKNGSGKSTLFSLMMGLYQNYEGSIKLNGKEIKTLKEKDIAIVSSFVPQNHNPTFGFSVYEFVLLGLASKVGMFSSPSKEDELSAINALKVLGIEEYKDRDYSEISGGERQIVTIARALASNPKMIIFDEPTAHLDFANQVKVLKIIKDLNKKGYTIAISTHDPNQAFILNSNVALLDNKGHLEKGSIDNMLTEEKLSEIYGIDIKIRYMDDIKCNLCIYKL